MYTAILTLHLLAAVAAVGGALAQSLLLGRARSAADPDRARAYRMAAVVPTRWLEAPGMIAVIATGAALAYLRPEILGLAFGLKMLAVAWLGIGTAIEFQTTRRIAALADAQGSALGERKRLETKLEGFGKISALAVLATLSLSAILGSA